MAAARSLLAVLASLVPAVAIPGDGPLGTEDYFWPKRGGTYIGHGAVPFDAPTDFRSGAAWTWENEGDELFRHGPVIDGKKNVYAATAFGRLQKFSPDGAILWKWQAELWEGRVVTSPFIYKGRLYISSQGHWMGFTPLLHCFDMEMGTRLWVQPVTARGRSNFDSHTVHVAEDVLLGALASHEKPAVGNNMIYAVNATDGSALWDFTLDAGVVWNFMPSTPGDGTFFFSTPCGRAERRRLSDGSLVWASIVPEVPHAFCSTGGATLGPNGVLYVEGNNWIVSTMSLPQLPSPGICRPPRNCPGILIAHNATNGQVLWANRIAWPFEGWQYPTVGTVDGRLTLVAGIGRNPALAETEFGDRWMPQFVRIAIGRLLYYSQRFRRFWGVPILRNAVAAYDAETGDQRWLWEEEPWDLWAAKGDEGPLLERKRRSDADPRWDAICGPDNWGIPAILADGTVVAGSGTTGKLYAIRDANGDGTIQDSEVRALDFGSAFLNGPAFAPGMMAVAPCWGKMYVYRSGAK